MTDVAVSYSSKFTFHTIFIIEVMFLINGIFFLYQITMNVPLALMHVPTTVRTLQARMFAVVDQDIF